MKVNCFLFAGLLFQWLTGYMTYKDDIWQLKQTYPEVAAAFGDMRTLEDVFKWIREVGSRAGAVDVIAQDEFSHDFVVELVDIRKFAAFGVT